MMLHITPFIGILAALAFAFYLGRYLAERKLTAELKFYSERLKKLQEERKKLTSDLTATLNYIAALYKHQQDIVKELEKDIAPMEPYETTKDYAEYSAQIAELQAKLDEGLEKGEAK